MAKRVKWEQNGNIHNASLAGGMCLVLRFDDVEKRYKTLVCKTTGDLEWGSYEKVTQVSRHSVDRT